MFGWVKRAVCGAVKAIGRAVAAGVEKVVEGGKKVVHFVADTYKTFSGQKVADEADRRLAVLKEKVRRRQEEFERFMEDGSTKLNAAISQINACRESLNDQLFPRFKALAANFSNWDVAGVRGESLAKFNVRNMDDVRARGELMKIDFRNHPISSNLAAVFTLGFYTRKMAKESLLQVQEEEVRMQHEFERLTAEETRIRGVVEAVRQVADQFKSMTGLYERVLDEVDYSVTLLKTSRNILAGRMTEGLLDVEFLPERQLLALKAADEATRIVFAIGARRYIKEDGKTIELVEEDLEQMRKSWKAGEDVERLLAA